MQKIEAHEFLSKITAATRGTKGSFRDTGLWGIRGMAGETDRFRLYTVDCIEAVDCRSLTVDSVDRDHSVLTALHIYTHMTCT